MHWHLTDKPIRICGNLSNYLSVRIPRNYVLYYFYLVDLHLGYGVFVRIGENTTEWFEGVEVGRDRDRL